MIENGTFSAIPEPADGRPEGPVYFRLTTEELQLLRAALASERDKTLRTMGNSHHTGTSQTAMQLCRRRSAIDALLERATGAGQIQAVDRTSPRRDTAKFGIAGRAA
jgi:hypothetical protein